MGLIFYYSTVIIHALTKQQINDFIIIITNLLYIYSAFVLTPVKLLTDVFYFTPLHHDVYFIDLLCDKSSLPNFSKGGVLEFVLILKVTLDV